jgi:hypothetical protein
MNPQQNQHSHLFLVRFRKEGAQEALDHKQLSGRVQHVVSGEARTFHEWPTLIELLLEMAETEGIDARPANGKTKEAF